jgi:O-antigen/teichoic acid export membrane protein
VRAARNAGALAVARLFSLALLFAWQVALARWLGPPDYGTYATIGALLAMAAILPELGMGTIVVRDVARRPEAAGRYLAATLVLQPVLGAVAYGGVLLAAQLFGLSVELRALMMLAALSLVIDTLGTMCHNQLLASERMETTAIIGAAHAGLLAALGSAACLAGLGLRGVYGATLVAGCARAGAYWLAVARLGRQPEFPPDRAVLRALVVGGLPLAGAAVGVLAHLHVDKLVTAAILGTAATGHLAAGQLVSFGIVELLSTSVLVAVLPRMAQAAVAEPGSTALAATVEQLTLLTAAAGLLLAVCTSVLLAPLATPLFGVRFAPTVEVLRVLLWSTAVAMTGNVFAQALVVQHRQGRLLAIRGVGLVLGLGGSLLLLPRLGVVGAPVASVVAESAVLGLLLRAFPLPGPRRREAARRVGRLALATLGLLVVLLLLSRMPIAAVAVGPAVYALLLRRTGALTAQDWNVLRDAARALPAPAWLRERRRGQPT